MNNADDQASKHRQRASPDGSRGHRTRRSRRRRGFRAYAGLLVIALIAVVGACLLYLWTSEPIPAAAAPDRPAVARGEAVERTAALAPLNLPADHAPHGSGMEWWYYNGILDAKTGERYAFHVAVFVANTLVKHTVMHVALTDLQTGKRFSSQSRTGGVPAQRVANGYDFRQEGWRVAASGASHVLSASFEGASIALDLSDSAPVVAHRAAGSKTPGLLDFGASGISYYYSRPRMSAQGRISVGGAPVQVSGQAWYDHQWGDFDVLSLGWNWFALHLADGSDLMLYELFDREGRKVTTAGTISTASGSTPIQPGEVELLPVTRWTSPRTRIDYAVGWRIKLPSGVLDVKPFYADSEFDSSTTTANVYWEGPVKVTGATTGEGFLELSGYDRLSAAPTNRR
ncbi:lipocalin family protein [Variovorax sp. J22G21]|uniref:lipocalin family protein n=1 Tax=Variovorax fucosicus TaxID=3053517 RepID=UPI0025755BD5|nr:MULTISPECIES: lipocalin family protein [unclassified Variovorax]MDM0037826.1 lipocalin family protein [Variovorax sp. J22R193]MDM0062602.1 lipocalin family protein [Variovorax sp. J22G21]